MDRIWTRFFNVGQGHSKMLKEYQSLIEATIQVINLNQEIFVLAFQNGLKAVYVTLNQYHPYKRI